MLTLAEALVIRELRWWVWRSDFFESLALFFKDFLHMILDCSVASWAFEINWILFIYASAHKFYWIISYGPTDLGPISDSPFLIGHSLSTESVKSSMGLSLMLLQIFAPSAFNVKRMMILTRGSSVLPRAFSQSYYSRLFFISFCQMAFISASDSIINLTVVWLDE